MNKKEPQIHCLSIDCPERLSICCQARCRNFNCSKCGIAFVGNPCTALQDIPHPTEQELREDFNNQQHNLWSFTHEENRPRYIEVDYDRLMKFFLSHLEAYKERVRGEIEGMYRKTTDTLEVMKEIRQAEIQENQWATADTKAGYNQALKDTLVLPILSPNKK